jgi:large subunit ribosomal protein L4
MASVDIKNLNNEVVGKLDLVDAVFAGPINEGLMHQAVKQYLASRRSGTHKTKTRAEVQGSGKKPWRQKGTGRARVGEIRNPLWRKGGTVFGPQPRDYEYHLPKKMFRAALKSALALKLKENQLNVIDSFNLENHKTKPFSQALARLGFDRKVLLVDHQENLNLWLAARNLNHVQLLANLQVTPYHVLNANHVVFSKAAIQALQEVLAK